MAQLAIKGHHTKGKEVIEILEMLGGKTSYECGYKDGFDSSYVFFINTDENFSIDGYPYNSEELKNYYIFTLEEFLEKFPYKVGDKVIVKGLLEYPKSIRFMEWFDDNIHYSFDNETWFLPSALQPYKETPMYLNKKANKQAVEINKILEQVKKIMEEGVYAYNEINCYHQDFADKVQIRLGGDYEIKVEDGKTYIVKKQPKYPKTYEECCKVLSLGEDGRLYTKGYKASLIQVFQQLIICRDAYWKIAGNWEPNWESLDKKYNIYNYRGDIKYDYFTVIDRCLLVFPTEEMRDAFFDNFKELIEQCKEML